MNPTRLNLIRARIVPLRQTLLAHPIYGRIDDLNAMRHFMEFHVFAVWDFMSLLKALQRRLCCVDVPWTPPTNAVACRLVNEIVLGEESDEDEVGNPASHFDLYHRAMRRCGADTGPIDQFIAEVRGGREVHSAIDVVRLPVAVGQFVRHTFEVIESGNICAIASAFTFGREGLLPGIFRRIVAELDAKHESTLDVFRFYLERHIEVDDGVHGPMAEKLVEDLCGESEAHWQAAEGAAVKSLEARMILWDGVCERIDRSCTGTVPPVELRVG